MLAVLLYNLWLLVDFLIQVSLDNTEEHRQKPRMNAKRFLNVAIEEVGGIGDTASIPACSPGE
ncbi:hypothetical protein [Haladaptatus sp. DFWS20]|uniref:hypothetical protein n=1 Tax=Haladaptatus sp. DFWS20 TaxID=3403467 RepID=UPI003EBC67B6